MIKYSHAQYESEHRLNRNLTASVVTRGVVSRPAYADIDAIDAMTSDVVR